MKAYALTDVGRVRQMNQDYQFASTEPVGPLSNLFIVADGMGGHRAGDFASRYLVEHLVSYIKECDDTGAEMCIRDSRWPMPQKRLKPLMVLKTASRFMKRET